MKILFKYLKKVWFVVLISIFLSFLYSLISGFNIGLIGPIVRILFLGQSKGVDIPFLKSFLAKFIYSVPPYVASLRLAIVLIVAYFFRGLFYYFQRLTAFIVEEKVIAYLREDLFNHVLDLPISFFEKTKKGEIISRFTYDFASLRYTISDGLLVFVKNFFMLIVYLYIILWASWRLTIFSLIFVLPVVLFMSYLSKKLKKHNLEVQKYFGKFSSYLQEILNGLKLIKGVAGETKEKYIFKQKNYKFYKNRIKLESYNSMALPVSEFLSAFVIGVILIMGAKLIFIDKILEPEKFVVFLAGVLSLTTPLKSFARANTFIQQSKAVFQRISQILSLPKEDKGGKIEFGRFKEKIEFKNVWFSYNGNKWALKNVSFVIKKGEKVALIGHSGAGKTTIIDLLLGFYKPQKGGIFVDGKNLFDYNLHSWRKKISIMPQEPFLFSGTLKENILYVSDVSDKELKDVLKKVGLNKPVDIEVGENGVMLSVGEKQRVTLARAILKKPEILILDEPTSSVDIETENKINKLIEEIAENKTLIIIAHRLNTIKKVDKVIVLENGEIKKIAKPFEILQEKGVGKWEK